MDNSPWSALSDTAANARIVFIADAGIKPEREVLSDWITSTNPGVENEWQIIFVAMARNPESINADALKALEAMDDNTTLIPVRVVWRSSVDGEHDTPKLLSLLFSNPHMPSTLRARSILSRRPGLVQPIVGDPATLSQVRSRYQKQRDDSPDSEQLASWVAGQALLALDIAERKLRGGRYKVPRNVAEHLRNSPKFKRALKNITEKTGESIERVNAEAEKIFKELIATPAIFWLDVFAMIQRKVASQGYDKIVLDEERLEHIRQITRDNPSVILFTHKTHVDAFALGATLFDQDFPSPHTLGGINMAFAGLGFVGRRAGVIFIRRSFRDSPVYKQVLRHYIGYLLQKRFPLSWAFEGTRSRNGKLMPPRYGLLKYVLDAANATDARNLNIIPVAINYDVIGDVKSFTEQEAGGVKRRESLMWFLEYLRDLRRPMGRIYMDFADPVVLEQAPEGEDTEALSRIAFQVAVAANRVSPMTPASLITTILLGSAPRALTRAELRAQLSAMVDWCKAREIPLAGELKTYTPGDLLSIVEVLIDNGIITRYEGGPELVYAVAQDQHAVASYYRNSTIHHFLNKAIIELSLAAAAAGDHNNAFWQSVADLRDLFKFEFFYAPSDEFNVQIREELNRIDPRWEKQLEKDPSALLENMRPLLAHATLLPYVEAYRVVADVLARLPETEAIDEKTCVQQALALGKQSFLQRRISSEASIGKLLFTNAWKLMDNRGLTSPGKAEERLQISYQLRELAHRLERLRALALPSP